MAATSEQHASIHDDRFDNKFAIRCSPLASDALYQELSDSHLEKAAIVSCIKFAAPSANAHLRLPLSLFPLRDRYRCANSP